MVTVYSRTLFNHVSRSHKITDAIAKDCKLPCYLNDSKIFKIQVCEGCKHNISSISEIVKCNYVRLVPQPINIIEFI